MGTKPTHIEILEVLESHGLANKLNLSPFLISKYGSISNNDRNDPSRVECATILLNLVERRYIELDKQIIEQTLTWIVENRLKWYNDEALPTTITSMGLDYLYQHRLLGSNMALNTAIRLNVRTQNLFSVSTIFVALAGLVLSVVNFRYNASNDLKYENLNKQLTEVTRLYQEQKIIQPKKQYPTEVQPGSTRIAQPSSLNNGSSALPENKKATPVRK